MYSQATTSSLDNLVHSLIKFGKHDVYRMPEADGIGITIQWHHGTNRYYINTQISMSDLYMSDLYMSDMRVLTKIRDMVQTRDSMIKEVIYWTNCKDIR